MKTSSLNRHVDYNQILTLLGVPPKSAALPALTNCPVCRGQKSLTIYVEPLDGGEWAYCRQCEFAGDMIALSAATWKLTINRTLRKLSQIRPELQLLGLPSSIADYQQHFVERRKFLHDFMDASRKNHLDAPTVAGQLLQRRYFGHAPSYDWADKTTKIMGLSSASAVRNDLRSTVCKGKGWAELLTVPFYSLPGLISGCLFIGREAAPDAADEDSRLPR